ncbi:hypothetical protein Micbo1qcDRAFT_174198 [Microdochium bolleyi]|uniref:Uncharacterized protein n=1 Tax=Microdochium bolleyi TaxID=196109 RepID=A0A136J7I3_9PEZI|nr:hypothetical protein Micbo1qcDRAFT_174198 [Microdochium bolleyi]
MAVLAQSQVSVLANSLNDKRIRIGDTEWRSRGNVEILIKTTGTKSEARWAAVSTNARGLRPEDAEDPSWPRPRPGGLTLTAVALDSRALAATLKRGSKTSAMPKGRRFELGEWTIVWQNLDISSECFSDIITGAQNPGRANVPERLGCW